MGGQNVLTVVGLSFKPFTRGAPLKNTIRPVTSMAATSVTETDRAETNEAEKIGLKPMRLKQIGLKYVYYLSYFV